MVRSETAAVKHISFLYQAYTPTFWYAEIVNCVYKLFMTAGIALLDYTLLTFEVDIVIRKGCVCCYGF